MEKKNMSLYDAFEIYKMMMDDVIARNPQFFFKSWEELVDVRDIIKDDEIYFAEDYKMI